MKPLRVDSAAREELLHKAQYIERAHPEYGKKFVVEVKALFVQIEQTRRRVGQMTKVAAGCA